MPGGHSCGGNAALAQEEPAGQGAHVTVTPRTAQVPVGHACGSWRGSAQALPAGQGSQCVRAAGELVPAGHNVHAATKPPLEK